MQPVLTLYHYWRSSCSWRVRWALALKGVSYQSVPVNILKGEHRQADYLAKNPAGFLPALRIGKDFAGESLAIIEWLEETYPAPALLPKDPLARLHVRQLALTIVAGTQPLQNPSFLKQVAAGEPERKALSQQFIGAGLKTYESVLGRRAAGRFSYGDEVTLADLCLVPQVYNAKRFDVDLAGVPLVTAIYDRCLATAPCEQAAPHNQEGAN
jgi:maleylacetoacetate isomerase